MKPAVFLDRDGVLTKEFGYAITSIDEMEIFPYAYECVKRLREAGYLTIVVTNQSAVAKGLFPLDELLEMNKKLMDEVKADAIYYCPHHPEGIVSRYSKICDCRKPKTGMIKKAQNDFDIDMSKSYMVGDRACDVIMGQNAGLKTILLNSGYGIDGLEEKCEPTLVIDNLKQAVEHIIADIS